MTTTDRQTRLSIEEIIARRPFGEDYVLDQDVLAPTNQLTLGTIQRTSTSGGKTATVKAGEDIRPALNSLKSAGGGTLILLAGTHRPTYDIVGDSKINIIGEGIDQTIIDFSGGSYQVTWVGSYGSEKNSFRLADLTVKNSGITNILIALCENFLVENIRSSGATLYGCNIQSSTNFIVSSSYFNDNSSYGLYTYDPVYFSDSFSFINCIADSNGNNGFVFGTDSNDLTQGGTILNCLSSNNTSDGFVVSGSSYVKVIGCTSSYNVRGFYLSGSSYVVSGCISSQNTSDGFLTGTGTGKIVGCFSVSDSGEGFNIDSTSSSFIIVGCNRSPDLGNDFIGTAVGNTLTSSIYESNVTAYLKNTSGSTINQGNVVIYKSVADHSEVSATTTQGDDKVIGVVLETGMNNNNFRMVMKKGMTTLLTVNGTSAIAVGDFLGTYTSAGIAMKAAAGDMAFAIALEAYSTADSNGVIDAILISPRKI